MISSSPRRTQIYITANSPGEVAGWLSPVVQALKRRDDSVCVNVVLTPCQYASGMEADVASSLSGVGRVVRLSTLIMESLFRRLKGAAAGDGHRCVLFLGGDALYAVLLSKLLNAPAYAYIGKPRWQGRFRKYLVFSESDRVRFIEEGVPSDEVEAVGQLCLDSVEIGRGADAIRESLLAEHANEDIITFLPGSRPVEVEFLIPFFMKAAEMIQTRCPKIHIFFAISPFADKRLIRRGLKHDGLRLDGRCEYFTTSSGCTIGLMTENPHELMSISKLVVTIPGTNNLQIAAMGTPMLIVTPLNRAERIPVDGLLGILNYHIFPIGLLKRKLIQNGAKHVEYLSLPNIIAGRQAVPELFGVLDPEDVALKAEELLGDDAALRSISSELRKIAVGRGAADKIAAAVLDGATNGR